MKRIDKTDEKILRALVKDGRASFAAIGTIANVSPENARYRVQRLQRKGVIKAFVADVAPQAFGLERFTVFIAYGRIRKDEEERFIKHLKTIRGVSWIGTLAGNWSLTFDLFCKDIEEATKLLERAVSPHRDLCREVRILQPLKTSFFFGKIIGSAPPPPATEKPDGTPDPTDREMLKLLVREPRISYVKLAAATRTSAPTAYRRVRALRQKGILRGASISLNHSAFGLDWHGLQLTQEGQETGKIEAFLYHAPEVIFYYRYAPTAEHRYDVGVAVRSSRQLREFINRMRTVIGDAVRIADTFVVLEEHTSHAGSPP